MRGRDQRKKSASQKNRNMLRDNGSGEEKLIVKFLFFLPEVVNNSLKTECPYLLYSALKNGTISHKKGGSYARPPDPQKAHGTIGRLVVWLNSRHLSLYRKKLR